MTIRKIIIGVIALQIISYFLLGDFMLERQVFTEFEEFSKRRLINKYNVQNDTIWEEFYFSSCGDEFFRDIKKLKQRVIKTNPKRYSSFEKEGKYFLAENTDFNNNPLEFHIKKADKEEKINVIHFGACRINKIPFLSTKVELKESFSTHTDFHSMMYNEQLLKYEISYIWILFKWVRLKKEKETQ